MTDLLEKPFDFILIETSGFTDPKSFGKVMMNFNQIYMTLMITMIDATTFLKLSKVLILLKSQVEIADIVLVNKCDLVDDNQLLVLKEAIYAINKEAKIFFVDYGKWNLQEDYFIKDPIHPIYQIEKKSLYFRSLRMIPCYEDADSLKEDLLKLQNLIYRVKGYVQIKENCFKIDGTLTTLEIKETDLHDQELIFLYDTRYIGKDTITQTMKS